MRRLALSEAPRLLGREAVWPQLAAAWAQPPWRDCAVRVAWLRPVVMFWLVRPAPLCPSERAMAAERRQA